MFTLPVLIIGRGCEGAGLTSGSVGFFGNFIVPLHLSLAVQKVGFIPT